MLCPSVLLVAHLVSMHAHAGANNENFGGGVECRGEMYSAAAGSYRNSYGRQSVYAVAGVRAFHFPQLGFRLDGVAGAATGYEDVRSHPFIAGVRATLKQGGSELGVLVFPPTKTTGAFVHLTVSFEL